MVYAIAAIIACIIGGFVWLGYKAYAAGKSTEQSNYLKEGAVARDRQDEEYDRSRGGLAERISGKLRDDDRRET